MEKEGGLPEAGVVNQPLPSKKEMEEALKRSALAILDPKETVQTESYEGPIGVSLEEAVAEKQPEMAEEKKKEKIKEMNAEGDKEAHPIKKKERRTSEKRERRREEMRLKKKEEKRKRVESPEVDGELTTTRVDEGVSVQPKEETTQIRTIATDDGEDLDITPLYGVARKMHRKGQ
ncbi:putative uncharacterized protein DDB_G0271982 [Benincasa hispida]|uniref:putative uncharacterized protein DDB_G0271982 n=1 Tax=Benincasa hispida TaxID=102211 RepID=UPI0019014085|nr:putative uncharacterized protein DDB_G0271982 [Benincasa hispida]